MLVRDDDEAHLIPDEGGDHLDQWGDRVDWDGIDGSQQTGTLVPVGCLALVGAALAVALSIWLLLATVATAGDGRSGDDGQGVASSGPTTTQSTESPATESPDSPPIPDPFEPAPNEELADAKRLGAAVVHHLTNYGPDSSLIQMVTDVTDDPALAGALVPRAQTVHYRGVWSRGTIHYAQLGGHLNDKASIMVVVRQVLSVDGLERAETRTMDVRVARDESGAWAFEELASTGGQLVARPDDLSTLAAAVVDNPRIELPDSAIWDIYSGHTDAALLQVMADLAERTPYSVIVLHTGHPRMSSKRAGSAITRWDGLSTSMRWTRR